MPASTATDVPPEDTRVEALLAQMTLEEKVGQLTQASGRHAATGPLNLAAADRDGLRSGRVGSMLNVLGARYTRGHQQEAMQSRLKIPLLFAHDVIHGYLTTFPVPLAEAASFDLVAIERSARVAATEAAAAGIHWTFAPMVDVGIPMLVGLELPMTTRKTHAPMRRRSPGEMAAGVPGARRLPLIHVPCLLVRSVTCHAPPRKKSSAWRRKPLLALRWLPICVTTPHDLATFSK